MKEKALHYEVPHRPWEIPGADVFMINFSLYFRLPQHIPNSEESNSLSEDDEANFCGIWGPKENYFRSGHKLHT